MPEHRALIFAEIFPHFAELMMGKSYSLPFHFLSSERPLAVTDPFGNYTSQKLFEYSSDDERDMLLDSLANDLVNVCLNLRQSLFPSC